MIQLLSGMILLTSLLTTPYEAPEAPVRVSETMSEAVVVVETAPVEFKYEAEARLIAQTIHGECGSGTLTEQAAVAWVILNRSDNWGYTVSEVVSAPYQFHGYASWRPYEDHYEIAKDVLERWDREKNGETDVGRIIPKEYTHFWGDGKKNHYTTSYQGSDYWDWSLVSPYA